MKLKDTCPECDSQLIELYFGNDYQSRPIVFTGCEECSETLETFFAEEFIEMVKTIVLPKSFQV